MRPSLPTTAVATLLLASHAVAETSINVGADETQLLTTALADDALHDKDVSTRVCFTEILSARQKTSGTTVEYEFDIMGCPVKDAKAGGGKCAESCTAVRYEVEVDKLASGALVVDNIDRDDDDSPSPTQTSAPGGTQPVATEPTTISAGANETQLLTIALGDDALYDKDVSTRVCFTEILRASQKTSGTTVEYEFDIMGCPVTDAKNGGGKCAEACTAVRYEVEVDKLASGVLVVDSVDREDDDADDIAPTKTTATATPTPSPSSSGINFGVSVAAVAVATLLAGTVL